MDPKIPNNTEETIPRGCLKLNNKLYSVYDGHNTIGRDPHAVINIKSLTISKSHAIITVIGNSHYISDLKSANGTRLDSKKVIPLKLYELKDGSSVRFGDVFCTYKKLGENERVNNNTEASQTFSEGFYGANTQDVRECTLPDGINFNELPTQIFAVPEPCINDMPTQLHNFDEVGDISNESIDFITMQKAETQLLTDDKPLSQIVPVALSSKKVIDSEESETDEDLTPSQVKPVKTGKKNVIESDSDTEEYAQPIDENKSRYEISDDSETDIEEDKEDEEKEKEGMVDQSEENNEQSTVGINEGQDEEKDGNEGKTRYRIAGPDHAYCQTSQNTETQNLDEIFGSKEEVKESRTTPAEEIAEDASTSAGKGNEEKEAEVDKPTNQIEDLVDQPAASSNVQENTKLNEDLDLFKLPTQQIDIIPTDNEEKPKEVDEDLDLFNQPTQQLDATSTENKEKPEGVDEDLDFFNQPTQQLDAISSIAEEKAKEADDLDLFNQPPQQPDATSTIAEEKAKEADEDIDLFKQPTQQMDPPENEKPTSDNETDIFDIFDQPTQQLDLDLVINKGNTQTQTKADDLYLQPTQTLDYLSSQKVTQDQKDEDDIYLQPTQALEEIHGEKSENSTVTPVPEANTQNLEALLEDDEDDSILPPTQALEAMHGGVQSSTPTKPSTSDLPSTQALESLLTDEKKPEEKKSEFVFSPPPLFKTPSPFRKKTKPQSVQKKDDDDEDFLQPTQAMEALHQDNSEFTKVQDEMYGIFASQSLLGTQQLVDVLDDDIIDDSINEGMGKSSYSGLPSLSIKKPISVEEVKEILGEGVEDEEGGLNVTGKTQGIKTYSRKKEETDEKSNKSIESKAEETNKRKEEVDKTGKNSEDSDGDKKNEIGETSKRWGRRKLDLVDVGAETGQESAGSSKGNKESKGRGKTNKNKDTSGEDKKEESEEKTGNRRGRSKQESDISAETGEGSTKSNNVNKGRGKTHKNKDTSGEDKKEESEEKTSNRRGRSKQNLDTFDKKKSNDESESSTSNKVTNKSKEENDKRGGRNQNLEDSSKSKNEESTDIADEIRNRRGRRRLNLEDNDKSETTKGRGRKKESLETPELSTSNDKEADVKVTKQAKDGESKDDGQEPSTSSEGTKTRGRRRLLPSVPEFQETGQNDEEEKEQTSASTSEGNKRRGRRKQETKENEDVDTNNKRRRIEKDVPTTPKKMKKTEETKGESSSTSSPKKRTFKTTSLNSEDDFVTKAPKLESVKRTPRGKKGKELQERNEDSDSVSREDASVSSTPSRTRRLSANSRRQKREQEVEETPERSRRVLKPKVVFTMMDSPELESLIRQLGGSVVDTVNTCTVLVTEHVKRTLKLLSAVAQGKPICSPQWLQACKRAGSFVDPHEYILVDEEAEKKWNFSLKESINRGSKRKLLENYTFQLMVNTAADVLKGSIEACGGKCVTRNLANCGTDNLLIVSTDANKSKFSKIIKQNPAIKVVEPEAIFDGTLRQDFRFDQFLVS